LRRHDEAVRARSVDRFSAAMRVLARRHADPGPAQPATPSGAQRGTAALLRPPAASGSTAAAPPPRRRPSKHAARVAAGRRRRVLYALLALTAANAGAAAAGLLPWWSLGAPALLIVVFLAACRRQVRSADEAYWADAKGAQPEPGGAVRVEATYRERSDNPDDEPTVVLRRSEPLSDPVSATASAGREPLAAPEQVVAVAVPTAEGESLWDPLPVTLPTYVTKPKAPRVVRTITLGEPGTSTTGAQAPAPRAVAPEPAPVAALDESEPRRAVGS
jgi:hypothetical protein